MYKVCRQGVVRVKRIRALLMKLEETSCQPSVRRFLILEKIAVYSLDKQYRVLRVTYSQQPRQKIQQDL